MTKPKVALVYDRVTTQFGGAEEVLQSLHEAFPEAPLFTGVYNPKTTPWAKNFQVVSTFLQKIPGAPTHHRLLAPLLPIAYEQLDLNEFDIIISISSAEAKGVITKPHQLHICYLLTPTRYLYSHKEEYVETIPALIRPVARTVLSYVAWWDSAAAHRPDYYLPISNVVAQRARTYYPNSKVLTPLYPPFKKLTRTNTTLPIPLPSNYSLSYGRVVSYKKFNLVLEAAAELNMPFVLIGDGPALKTIKKRAAQLQQIKPGLQFYFLPHQSKEDLSNYILHAAAVVFPAEEDFGISQAESMISGARVVINKQSGAAEIAVNLPKQHKHIYIIKNTSIEEIKTAIVTLASLPANASINSNHLTKYDYGSFKESFKHRVYTLWKEWRTL